MTGRQVLLTAALGDRAATVLAELVPPGTRCAVIDVPLHSNVGDSAIWLGQRALLRRLRAEVGYACDQESYSARQLAAALPSGPILLQGGGSLGDLWDASQRLRERVVQDFPDRRIIQLPQSVHFRARDNLTRARAVFDAHPGLTLLLRDQRSLHIARSEFAARSLLCPDMAFLLPPGPSTRAPVHDIAWLARQDHESAAHHDPAARSHHHFDWAADEGAGLPWLAAREHLLRRRRSALSALEDEPAGGAARELCRVYDGLARLQVLRGNRLLTSGRVVVTDRLHGHVMSLLLGRPHVVVADRHHKLRSFWETWTSGWEGTTWAWSDGEALGRAQALVRQARLSPPGPRPGAEPRSPAVVRPAPDRYAPAAGR